MISKQILDSVLMFLCLATPILVYLISHYFIANRLLTLSKKVKKHLIIFDIVFVLISLPASFFLALVVYILAFELHGQPESLLNYLVGILALIVFNLPIGLLADYLLPARYIINSQKEQAVWVSKSQHLLKTYRTFTGFLEGGLIFWSIINWMAILHIPFLIFEMKKHMDKSYKQTALRVTSASIIAWFLSFISVLLVYSLFFEYLGLGALSAK